LGLFLKWILADTWGPPVTDPVARRRAPIGCYEWCCPVGALPGIKEPVSIATGPVRNIDAVIPGQSSCHCTHRHFHRPSEVTPPRRLVERHESCHLEQFRRIEAELHHPSTSQSSGASSPGDQSCHCPPPPPSRLVRLPPHQPLLAGEPTPAKVGADRLRRLLIEYCSKIHETNFVGFLISSLSMKISNQTVASNLNRFPLFLESKPFNY
jgi:hypothetical protein